ncbi:LexA family protein [Agaribacterium sp. ZY112]|uniref:LexA family protein n=1 Tax=Agaribacterium sp. ZY112 TaxID=3233574 RepID=UPI0035237E59
MPVFIAHDLIPEEPNTKLHRYALYSSKVPCGFPSPADDFSEETLNLSEYLIKHPASTFFARAEGESMHGAGINDGDLLVVDRAQPYVQGAIAIVSVCGELTCKQLDLKQQRLLAANSSFPPIPITEDLDTIIEGIVIWVIKNTMQV